MGRRKHVVPWVAKEIRLPADLLAEIELLLYSEASGGVPYGALNRLLTSLLRSYLEALKQGPEIEVQEEVQ